MTTEMTIKASIENWNQVRSFIEDIMVKNSVCESDMIQMDIAAEELFVNVASYAYAPGQGMITIQVDIKQDTRVMKMTFIDQGTPYNPLDKEDPDVTLGLDEREIGGLGIYMVKQSMDDVVYEYKNNCNILTIIKNLE